MSQPDGTHALLISDATPADAGSYGVIAVNDKGETASKADLTVASEYFTLETYLTLTAKDNCQVGIRLNQIKSLFFTLRNSLLLSTPTFFFIKIWIPE